jgi:hypothetical protein
MSTDTPPAPIKPAAVVRPPASEFVLPGAKRSAKATLNGTMIWIYGEPKIGKTTFAAGLGETWFIATEKGHDFIEVREPTTISSWQQFRKFVEWLHVTRPTTFSDGKKIEWIAIDVVDRLFQMCNDEVCKSLSIEDPGELAHGKAWGRLRTEFGKVMTALRNLPYGLICISHERSKEITIRSMKISRFEPSTGAGAAAWLQGASDIICRAFAKEEAEKVGGKVTGRFITRRLMQLHPTANAVAGGRMSQSLPPIMDLDATKLREAVSKCDISESSKTIDDSDPLNTPSNNLMNQPSADQSAHPNQGEPHG